MTDHTDERPIDTTDDELGEDEALEGDRPSGWAGVTDALEGTENRPAGPDYGDSPLDDETPGSQGEIESARKATSAVQTGPRLVDLAGPATGSSGGRLLTRRRHPGAINAHPDG